MSDIKNRQDIAKVINKRDGLLKELDSYHRHYKDSSIKPGSVDFLVAQSLLIGLQMKAVCVRAELTKLRGIRCQI